jgi:cytoskeleton-associated protein 5
MGDGVESVRNESAESLGVLMKIVGERAMNPVLEPLDELRKAKVKEAFEKAVVKCKVGSAAPAPKAPPKADPPKVLTMTLPELDYLTPSLTQKKAPAHKPKLEEVDGGADEGFAAPKLPPKLAAKVSVR